MPALKSLALGLVLLPSLAWGQAATYADRSGTITSGGVAQTLAPVSPNRRGCMIQNQSAGDLWVSSTAAAAATQPAIRIPSGAQYLCMSPAESGALSIFGATTAQAFAAREW